MKNHVLYYKCNKKGIPGNFPGIYTIEKCSVLTVKAMAHVCFMRKEAKHCMLHIVYTVRNGW